MNLSDWIFLEKLEKSQVKFTIEINEAEVEAAIQEAYNKNKSHYKLEGFRPGKVPRKVLEAEFGKDVFLNDALDIILPKYFEEALEKETSVEPVSRPEADILEASDKAVKFAVTITVQPEVKLGKYKGAGSGRADSAAGRRLGTNRAGTDNVISNGTGRSLSNKIPALFSFQRGVRLCRTISCETRRCRRWSS